MDYNPLDTETIANPYAVYSRLRETKPVFWSKRLSTWVVTRYADCKAVLKNNDLFARDLRRIGRHLQEGRDSIQTRDPPHQTELRHALSLAAGSAGFDGTAARGIQTLCQLLSQRSGRGSFDLMSNVAAPLAFQITSELFGADAVDSDLIHMIFRTLTRGMDANLYPTDDRRGIEAAEHGLEAADALEVLMIRWLSAAHDGGIIANLKSMLSNSILSSVTRPCPGLSCRSP